MLDPQQVLARGYSMVRDGQGRIVVSSERIKLGRGAGYHICAGRRASSRAGKDASVLAGFRIKSAPAFKSQICFNMTNDISRRGLRLLLLVVVLIWFGNLEYRKLIRPDEGRYAEIPREMVVSGDWTTPRLNDLKYFEKPPLQYWATAVAYEVFGEHQWTSRLWTALTGFAGILLAWFAGDAPVRA